MCLANAYKQKKSPDSLICEYVSKIKIGDQCVILTDIMNNETSVDGIISEIDLENNTIIIASSK